MNDPFGPLVATDKEAPFAEQWQAQLMALAYSASQSGLFSAAEWSEAFGAELRNSQTEDRESYYRAALTTLQFLLQAKGALSPIGIAYREEAWRQAYLHTPHGMPVELDAGRP